MQTLIGKEKLFAGKLVNNYCGSGHVLLGRLLYPVVLYLYPFMIRDDTSENA